jgi:hypothetical protein
MLAQSRMLAYHVGRRASCRLESSTVVDQAAAVSRARAAVASLQWLAVRGTTHAGAIRTLSELTVMVQVSEDACR